MVVLEEQMVRVPGLGCLCGCEIASLGTRRLEQEVPIGFLGRTVHARRVNNGYVLCKIGKRSTARYVENPLHDDQGSRRRQVQDQPGGGGADDPEHLAKQRMGQHLGRRAEGAQAAVVHHCDAVQFMGHAQIV
jgi:hypothetical protein